MVAAKNSSKKPVVVEAPERIETAYKDLCGKAWCPPPIGVHLL